MLKTKKLIRTTESDSERKIELKSVNGSTLSMHGQVDANIIEGNIHLLCLHSNWYVTRQI